MDRLYLMRDAKVKEGLIKIGVPSIIGLLMIGFYNFVDSYFVAQLGTYPMGALSLSFPFMTLMPGIGLLFGNGASAYISELLGANKHKKAEIVLSSVLAYTSVFSILSIVIYFYLEDIFIVMGASAEVLPYAMDYSKILVISFVFHIPSVALNNLVRAEGANKLSAWSQVVGSILNIVLDPILMFQMNLGIVGAAIATAFSQFISFIILLQYYIRKKSLLQPSIKNVQLKKWILKPVLAVGLPLFAVNLFQSISMTLVNYYASSYGDHVLAAMGIVTRIITMLTLGLTGYSRGYQNFASFNYGAKKEERLKEANRLSYLWTITFSIVLAILLIITRKSILKAFTQDPQVLKIADIALIVNLSGLFLYAFQSIGTVYLLVIKENFAGFIFSIARQGLVFIPTLILLNTIMQVNSVIYVQVIVDFMTTIMLYIYIKKIDFKFK